MGVYKVESKQIHSSWRSLMPNQTAAICDQLEQDIEKLAAHEWPLHFHVYAPTPTPLGGGR